MATCGFCRGTGRCPKCNGSGRTDHLIRRECPACGAKKLCIACGGKGTAKR